MAAKVDRVCRVDFAFAQRWTYEKEGEGYESFN